LEKKGEKCAGAVAQLLGGRKIRRPFDKKGKGDAGNGGDKNNPGNKDFASSAGTRDYKYPENNNSTTRKRNP